MPKKLETAMCDNDLEKAIDYIELIEDLKLLEDSQKIAIKSEALATASLYGMFELVKYLVEHGANINGENIFGTALVEASYKGHFEIVKYLIDNGANPDIPAKQGTPGYTPLMFACKHDYYDIVVYLVEHGADMNITSPIVNRTARSLSGYEIDAYLKSKGARE